MSFTIRTHGGKILIGQLIVIWQAVRLKPQVLQEFQCGGEPTNIGIEYLVIHLQDLEFVFIRCFDDVLQDDYQLVQGIDYENWCCLKFEFTYIIEEVFSHIF